VALLSSALGAALAVLAALMLLSGCGGGNGDGNRRAILDNYEILADAIERKDLKVVMSLVSVDYLHNGVDREGFRATFQNYFDTHINIEAWFAVRSIEFEWVDRDYIATVKFDSRISGDLLSPEGVVIRRETEENVESVMFWILEGGYWRMLGNQEEARELSIAPGKRTIGSLLGEKGLTAPTAPTQKRR
jgi:hypothetical protein